MEGPERTWFGLQGGGCTKDQGPGFWSDAMDDKFSHWNWSKLIGLGTYLHHFFVNAKGRANFHKGSLLAKKYLNAVEKADLHAEVISLINAGLPRDLVDLWTAKIITWENDRSAPNPYYTPETSKQA